MQTTLSADDRVVAARQTSEYSRPAWTAELRRLEEAILRRLDGVTWS